MLDQKSEKIPLEELLDSIESEVGQIITGFGFGYMPPIEKPAYKFLMGLGYDDKASRRYDYSKRNKNAKPLTNWKQDIQVGKLTITSGRIRRLAESGKISINANVITKDRYQEVIAENGDLETLNNPSRKGVWQKEGDKVHRHWHQAGVGICHIQEIDFLVTHEIKENDFSKDSYYDIWVPRSGKIEEHDNAVLLLSNPALDFRGLSAPANANLSMEDREWFIFYMYCHLFSIALSEKREYIVMPAGGLEVLGGDAELYFKMLINAAKKYPSLNIIYHPGDVKKDRYVFLKALEAAREPENIVRAEKDVFFIADSLRAKGYSVALHNPSAADVVFGLNDVGNCWKSSKVGYAAEGYEEYLGSITTAPLNSFYFNPAVYQDRRIHPVCFARGEEPFFPVSSSISPQPRKPNWGHEHEKVYPSHIPALYQDGRIHPSSTSTSANSTSKPRAGFFSTPTSSSRRSDNFKEDKPCAIL